MFLDIRYEDAFAFVQTNQSDRYQILAIAVFTLGLLGMAVLTLGAGHQEFEMYCFKNRRACANCSRTVLMEICIFWAMSLLFRPS